MLPSGVSPGSEEVGLSEEDRGSGPLPFDSFGSPIPMQFEDLFTGFGGSRFGEAQVEVGDTKLNPLHSHLQPVNEGREASNGVSPRSALVLR
jgi:hypothetical protein